MGTWEHGNIGTWEHGNIGTWEHGNKGMPEQIFYSVIISPPVF